MKASDRLSDFGSRLGASAKSLIKVALQSRPCSIGEAKAAAEGKPPIIMGNGPSLGEVIKSDLHELAGSVTMALNFAANAEEFTRLRPDFYLMADPHFFQGEEIRPQCGALVLTPELGNRVADDALCPRWPQRGESWHKQS